MAEPEPQPPPFSVWGTLAEALRVYRLLFQRSVITAAVVYAVIALIRIANAHPASGRPSPFLALVLSLAGLSGPLLVQGALVEIVRNVHEGRAPEGVGSLFARSAGRFWTLLASAFVYALGVFFALLLLIVPGLIVAARWSLFAPLIMLERLGVGEARRRSSALVTGRTGRVLVCVTVVFVITDWFSVLLILAHVGYGTETFLDFVWSSLTAPFAAHVLTVIYYRLADPGRPVVDPAVRGWRSVWEGR